MRHAVGGAGLPFSGVVMHHLALTEIRQQLPDRPKPLATNSQETYDAYDLCAGLFHVVDLSKF